MMKIRDKNPLLASLIRSLEEKGRQEKTPLWAALAKKLNRPRRMGYEVNMFRLEKHAAPKETVVVPGSVLGSGKLTKPLAVAALRFSGKAEEKIKKAGGSCISIEKFAGEYKKGKKILIMG